MCTLSDILSIESKNNSFILSCCGDFAEQTVTIGETNNGLVFSKKSEDHTIQGSFDLKYLNLFTKSTNLCSTIELFLKQDYPLILLYSVANLGSLKFCLAPKCKT